MSLRRKDSKLLESTASFHTSLASRRLSKYLPTSLQIAYDRVFSRYVSSKRGSVASHNQTPKTDLKKKTCAAEQFLRK